MVDIFANRFSGVLYSRDDAGGYTPARFGKSNDDSHLPSVAQIAEFQRRNEAALKVGGGKPVHFKIDLSDPDFKNYPVSPELEVRIQERTAAALEFVGEARPKEEVIAKVRRAIILNDYIRETLKASGVNPEECVIRIFNPDRIPHALGSGTDRGHGSTSRNEDTPLLRAYGIFSQANVTYVAPLNEHWAPDPPERNAFVVYKKSGLHQIGLSNGLHAFLGAPHNSLVAVFSSRGDTPMVEPKHKGLLRNGLRWAAKKIFG